MPWRFLTLMATGVMSGRYDIALVSAALMGATLAFLRYNFLKKVCHLGDSGSLFMGFCLAAFVPLFQPKVAGLAASIIPVAVLSTPIAEVVVTTIRRFLMGKPVTAPDSGHVHYMLLQKGLDKRQVTWLIQGVSFSCGIVALSMTFVFNQNIAQILVVLWVLILLCFVGFSYIPQKGRAPQKQGNRPFVPGHGAAGPQKALEPFQDPGPRGGRGPDEGPCQGIQDAGAYLHLQGPGQ